MKAFVTGGTGYTGGALCTRLAEQGHQVRALARKTSKTDQLRDRGIEIIFGDVRDIDSLRPAMKDVDVLFHLAALYRQAGFPEHVYHDIHVKGTENMLQVALEEGVKRFIHCSTIGVLGHISNPPANEETPCNPGDIYQITKMEGEKLALRYFREKNLPVTVIRPAAIYGPGDMRMLKLFRSIAKGRFVILGSGETTYHQVYIDDLITGFLLGAEKDVAIGQIYIIGGEEYVTLNQLTTMIAHDLGVSPPKLHLPVKPFQWLGSLVESVCIPLRIEPPIHRRRVDFFTKSRAFDISRAKRDLGYQPQYDLKTGIHLTAQWYRERGYLN
ncbi:NAD-dependent epimerase/dehydratase family protein [Candidatus Hakubella thermalkaliphila]|uniref:UDP-glucose 4-epimerase n=1 Tax=Candidatus Hakubella thermalkaliphila TaxID=2754717 RepID=A0A6V8P4E1_9ACTN|nr:NAD-dependent epimerase/dehydratase family protein [Candidatus Hakubella thermalkaliphila]GFP26700.1 UDP-glucose 4-epimerase [Candidatus Hakubella thermalkaliphila]